MTTTTEERKLRAEFNAGVGQTDSEEVQDEDASGESNQASSPNIVVFALVLGAAITVDAIDAAELTGFLAILTKFIDIPTLGFLWLWRIMSGNAGAKKDVTFQILLAFLVELSPLGIIPTWSIFVAYVYFKDTKMGKQTIGKVQKITKLKAT